MVVRRKKKARKLRGSRTHGWGSPKKHRGKGSKGGKGNAGRGKKGQQKMSLVHAAGKKRIGKRGFISIRQLKGEKRVINVGKIEENLNSYVKQKIAAKKANIIEVDISKLGYSKVLGGGTLRTKIRIKGAAVSRIAEQKIKAAGGEVIKEERSAAAMPENKVKE